MPVFYPGFVMTSPPAFLLTAITIAMVAAPRESHLVACPPQMEETLEAVGVGTPLVLVTLSLPLMMTNLLTFDPGD